LGRAPPAVISRGLVDVPARLEQPADKLSLR
jgi:hypothetical protein